MLTNNSTPTNPDEAKPLADIIARHYDDPEQAAAPVRLLALGEDRRDAEKELTLHNAARYAFTLTAEFERASQSFIGSGTVQEADSENN